MEAALGEVKLPSGEVEAKFRSGWLRHFRVVLSSASGAAVVLGIFTLLQQRPSEGFRLLDSWGPWPVLAIVVLVLAAPFLARLSETIGSAFTAIVAHTQRTADAQTKTAEALSELADYGKRQFEEVERLAVYAAREFPGVYERFDQTDQALKELATSMTLLHQRLDSGKGESR